MDSVVKPQAPAELGAALRTAQDALTRRRRQVVALDLVAATCMGFIAAYQLGLTRRLPDPNLPRLNSPAIVGSGRAYAMFSVGDAFLGFASYAVTMLLAAAGGPSRHQTHPYLPLALAGKASADAAMAAKMTVDQWRSHRAFCSWCVAAAAASCAAVPLVVPEARAALRHLASRSHIERS